MGTAGTRKTYLIKAIREIAVFNIDGITIHSGLSIPIINDSKHLDINGEWLKQLQDKLSDVRYVIIDKLSMISRQMLIIIDMWFWQAFSEHNNKLFGSRSVILFGDFGQLSPVLDLPMYANDKQDVLSNSDSAVYKQFKEVYKLEIIQCQSENSKKIEDKLSVIKRNEFSNVLFLLTKWSEVNTVNIDQLRSSDIHVAKIQAIHTGSNKAKKADSDIAHKLEAYILLARGAQVMLTANLQTEIKLVNSAMRIVQEIIFSEDQGLPCLPTAVLISFDNYKRPTITA
ncbi:ATP-dependent DNA helicase Pif1-like [Rhizophagus clarus]|uniref:ATP-dependent DNA helicase n=1 Tax=Rhizophagus clarus TaxID=94130 RepID=A0A8H3LNG9_9GLOM|nr:ATP-dependent DNA helicase Pif1-like [Rhizophagus clarus]